MGEARLLGIVEYVVATLDGMMLWVDIEALKRKESFANKIVIFQKRTSPACILLTRCKHGNT